MAVAAEPGIQHFTRAGIISAIFLSLLQGVFFALDLWKSGFSFYNLAAVGLAVTTIVFSIRFALNQSTELLARVILLYCGQLAFFIVKLIDVEPIAAPRLLEVSVILMHALIVGATLLSRFHLSIWHKFLLAGLPIALLVFAAEIILPTRRQFQPRPRASIPVDWKDAMQQHPTLEVVYRPNSNHTDHYAQNPHNYFKSGNDQNSQWWLRTGGGSEASMVTPSNDPQAVRVEIKKADSKTAYDIQLNLTKLKAQVKHPYRIKFRARADQPRSLFVGFAQSHEPWQGLGFYQKAEIKSDWQDFQFDFVPSADDDNARIHFDLGESATAVEISELHLLSMPDGKPIESEQTKYAVDYRFNSQGCRGPEYAIPKPAGTKRILVLGDSFAMGAGVYEADTFAAKLQTAINQNNNQYEVINCGIDDYGVQQDRLFYKFTAKDYQPDLVLLVLTPNADYTVLEEMNKRGPLFYTWQKFWKHFYPFDYSEAAEEITQLNLRLRNDGSRLALIFFRTNSDFKGKGKHGKQWNALINDISHQLKDVPMLDLGKPLHEKLSDAELSVLPKKDYHPNHTAHAIAAEQILEFVKKENLVK